MGEMPEYFKFVRWMLTSSLKYSLEYFSQLSSHLLFRLQQALYDNDILSIQTDLLKEYRRILSGFSARTILPANTFVVLEYLCKTKHHMLVTGFILR